MEEVLRILSITTNKRIGMTAYIHHGLPHVASSKLVDGCGFLLNDLLTKRKQKCHSGLTMVPGEDYGIAFERFVDENRQRRALLLPKVSSTMNLSFTRELGFHWFISSLFAFKQGARFSNFPFLFGLDTTIPRVSSLVSSFFRLATASHRFDTLK